MSLFRGLLGRLVAIEQHFQLPAPAPAPAAAMTDAVVAAAASAGPKAPQKKFYRSRAHCNPLSHNDSFD